jgi:RimJ/RimL family protein N-acetyltransferase
MDRLDDIRGERLILVSLSPEMIEQLLARTGAAVVPAGFAVPDGWPDEHDEGFLRMRHSQMEGDPEVQEWLVRAMVLTEGALPRMIGHIGFHGPPIDGAAELGYTVFPDYRRRGYALEAAGALMGWARKQHGVRRFIVSVSPENGPSLAMAAKMGFRKIGEQIDEEDGLEYVFELRT